MRKYRIMLPSCILKCDHLRCGARFQAWTAVNCGSRYTLPTCRTRWVRSASYTYMKYPSSKPPTARNTDVRMQVKLPVQNSISVGTERSASAMT